MKNRDIEYSMQRVVSDARDALYRLNVLDQASIDIGSEIRKLYGLLLDIAHSVETLNEQK